MSHRRKLEWAAWALPPEEHEATPSEVAAIDATFRDLQESIDVAGLTSEMRAFMLHQIGLLRAALRQHPISGTVAVGKALEKAAGALLRPKRNLVAQTAGAPPESSAWLSRLGDGLDTATSVCEKAEQVRKGLHAAWRRGAVFEIPDPSI